MCLVRMGRVVVGGVLSLGVGVWGEEDGLFNGSEVFIGGIVEDVFGEENFSIKWSCSVNLFIDFNF